MLDRRRGHLGGTRREGWADRPGDQRGVGGDARGWTGWRGADGRARQRARAPGLAPVPHVGPPPRGPAPAVATRQGEAPFRARDVRAAAPGGRAHPRRFPRHLR